MASGPQKKHVYSDGLNDEKREYAKMCLAYSLHLDKKPISFDLFEYIWYAGERERLMGGGRAAARHVEDSTVPRPGLSPQED